MSDIPVDLASFAAKSEPRYYEITDLDADERSQVNKINAILDQRMSSYTEFGIKEQMKFESEAVDRYNQVGLEINVEWERLPNPKIDITAYQPKITILGKLYKHDTDYDKIKHDTVTGKIDGVEGVIRDGQLREPKSKDIY